MFARVIYSPGAFFQFLGLSTRKRNPLPPNETIQYALLLKNGWKLERMGLTKTFVKSFFFFLSHFFSPFRDPYKLRPVFIQSMTSPRFNFLFYFFIIFDLLLNEQDSLNNLLLVFRKDSPVLGFYRGNPPS